jgi:hypothetical protein
VLQKSIEQESYSELKQFRKSFFLKKADIGLSMMKLQVLKRNDSKDDIISFDLFNCVNYNLIFDSAFKDNAEAVAEQDFGLVVNGFKKYQ